MKTVKLKDKLEEVRLVQVILKELGYTVGVDGDFGPNTLDAVKKYQTNKNINPTGNVGDMTWEALLGDYKFNALSDQDYTEAAKVIGCEVACIKAVKEVETGSAGAFLSNNMPTILFEGHIFWKQLKNVGLTPENYVAQYSDVLYPKWDRTKYKGGLKEYDRLEKAKQINVSAALASASYGFPQIMGFNYQTCGFSNVTSFVNEFYKGQKQQLLAFVKFIKGSGLAKHLIDKNWDSFARGYNGPEYKKNNYDVKLKTAYEKYVKKK